MSKTWQLNSTITAEWGRGVPCIAQYLKIKASDHWADTKFIPVTIGGCTRSESPCLECLLALKLTLNFKWNLYINDCFLVSLQKYSIPTAMLYFWESDQAKNAAISGLMLLSPHCLTKTVQNQLHSLVGNKLFSTLQPLSHQRKLCLLPLYCYFSGKLSDN